MAIGEEIFKAFGAWKDVIKKFPVKIDEAAKNLRTEFFYFSAPARFYGENK
jgi:hypothetical protein